MRCQVLLPEVPIHQETDDYTTASDHKPLYLLLAQWPDHNLAMVLDGHGISQDNADGARGCSPRPPRRRGRLQLPPAPLLRSTKPTENQEMLTTASMFMLVIPGRVIQGRQINCTESKLASSRAKVVSS
jgi:hypothetical protein